MNYICIKKQKHLESIQMCAYFLSRTNHWFLHKKKRLISLGRGPVGKFLLWNRKVLYSEEKVLQVNAIGDGNREFIAGGIQVYNQIFFPHILDFDSREERGMVSLMHQTTIVEQFWFIIKKKNTFLFNETRGGPTKCSSKSNNKRREEADPSGKV